MASLKIFKKLNDSTINETWKPIVEAHGGDLNTRPWLSDYCHYHAMFDQTSTPQQLYGALFESGAPGLFFQQPTSISQIGSISAPTSTMTPFTAGGAAKNAYYPVGTASGSGDKFPTLMPVAIQVASKTIAFDFTPVVTMDAPVGFLPYLDYVYLGGNLDSNYEPFLIKIQGITPATAMTTTGGGVSTWADLDNNVQATIVVGGQTLTLRFVGFSRMDANPIFRVINDTSSSNTIATYVANGNTITFTASTADYDFTTTTTAALTSALENHISGFTSMSDDDYAAGTSPWIGPFLPEYGDESNLPTGMKREVAEKNKFRSMGIKMFTKFVEAIDDQVKISATINQIQDLNRVWNYDIISMLENTAVNDVAQSINKLLVIKHLQLGKLHTTKIGQVEGSGITTLNLAAGFGGFENITTLQRRVATKILEMANLIYHRGRFGNGTFVVTNGRVASALADAQGYSIAPFSNDLPSGAGQLYPAGKVYGLQVYVDPNFKWGDSRIFIGRKGGDEEPGIKFMPYIMAESFQTVSESTMSPVIALKSRYAITEAGWHPESQYITMTVDNLGILTGSTLVPQS